MLDLSPKEILESYVAFIRTIDKALKNKIPISYKSICPASITFNDKQFAFNGHAEDTSFVDPNLRKKLKDIRIVSVEKYFIYSLGATLYYYLTGEVADPTNLNVKDGELAEDLAFTLDKSLQLDPFDRHETLEDFINDLNSILEKYQLEEQLEIQSKLEYTKVFSKSRAIQIASVCSITILCLITATVCMLTNFNSTAWSQNHQNIQVIPSSNSSQTKETDISFSTTSNATDAKKKNEDNEQTKSDLNDSEGNSNSEKPTTKPTTTDDNDSQSETVSYTQVSPNRAPTTQPTTPPPPQAQPHHSTNEVHKRAVSAHPKKTEPAKSIQPKPTKTSKSDGNKGLEVDLDG